MRIFKGLENIHAVIDRHDNEWRREQGEPEVKPYTPNEKVRQRLEESTRKGSGKLNADRFLGKKAEQDSTGPEVEIVEVIKQEGVQHSWLYNEIEKAVKDAVGSSRKNTKVIAIFIPVIQNAKEFEDLPVDEKVTLPPVQEETQQEDDALPFEITLDELAETTPLPQIDVPLEATHEIIEETLEPVVEKIEEIAEKLDEIEEEIAEELSTEQEPEAILEQASEENHDFDLVPEGPEHPDEELAEAFSAMEEKLAEELPEPEPEEILEESSSEEPVEGVEEEESESFPEPETEESEPELENLNEDNAVSESPEQVISEPAENIEENIESVETLENLENETPEELAVIEEAPVESEPEPESEPDEPDGEESNGEAMSFEEFPVLPTDESEEISEANAEDFFEEVTPSDSGPSFEQTEIKRNNILEPPAIEDFDDDEVFEEPLEVLYENDEPEIEYEYTEESDNIHID